jgi:hypothetical protein
MTDTEIEELRGQKMTALRQAREAYRRSMVEPDRSSLGNLFSVNRLELHDAVMAADSDLRLFNSEHPRS